MLSLTVLMYHYVRDPGDAAQGASGIRGLSPARFVARLDALAGAYTVVNWPDVCAALSGERPLPPRALLLTFDDGVRDHYLNVFPALRARNLSGLFFAMPPDLPGLVLGHKLHYLLDCLGLAGLRRAVLEHLNDAERERFARAESAYRARTTNEVDLLKLVLQRELSSDLDPFLGELVSAHVAPEAELAAHFYLTAAQRREMLAGGMYFGGHSLTHPWLDFLTPAQRAVELEASRAWLAALSDAPFPFAYPYGGLAPDLPRQLAASDFSAAFTTRQGTEHSDPYYIGRYDGEEWDA